MCRRPIWEALMKSSDMILEVESIDAYYGLSHILFEVSLTVSRGEIVCLLGRNGAGKSTTMKSIMGLVPPSKGTVRFKGENVTRAKPYILARKGIGYVPDDRRVFADLTVDENLEIAEKRSEKGSKWNRDAVYRFFPPLKDLKSRKGGLLSGGEQQMLTVARALMTDPDLLLLDEPTEGLAPLIVKMLEEQILKLKETGLTVLLAEQNQKVALNLSDRGYVIDNGAIRFHGTSVELRDNEEIRKKYLLV
jgi:branched-chain amino acid transport system ATP-binding protein